MGLKIDGDEPQVQLPASSDPARDEALLQDFRALKGAERARVLTQCVSGSRADLRVALLRAGERAGITPDLRRSLLIMQAKEQQ